MMNEPSREEMERMQKDAERRIREMQRRADRAVTGGDMPPVPNFVQINPGRHPHNHEPSKPPPEPERDSHEPNHRPSGNPPAAERRTRRGFDILRMFNFKHFNLDSDKILIIALLFLLSAGDADELLLLALVYIML